MSDPVPRKDGITPPPGLADGFIFPQRSLISNLFFKHKKIFKAQQQHSRAQQYPDFVRVQVGTRRDLEECLRSAGPGSLLLWVEVPDEESIHARTPGITYRLFKSQLQLAYRLRSFTILLQPVFPGLHVVASPHAECSSSDKENLNGHSLGTHALGKWHSLRQREREKFLKSIGVSHLGNDFCVLQGQNPQRSQPTRINRWFLALPLLLYEQLVQMISPGGILWYFQQLVKRLVHISLFIDVKFELINFESWLKDHSYVAMLEGSEFLVCSSTLHWSIIKFDFSDNVLRIAGGRCIESLHRFWDENVHVDLQQEGSSSNTSTEFDKYRSGWNLWDLSNWIDDRECATLLDVIYKKGGFSEQEAACGFKQDFSFLNDFKMENIFLAPRSQELCFCSFSSPSNLSSKERCALSKLSSTSRTVRQRGIHILLDILLHDDKGKVLSGRSDSRIGSSNRKGILTPISMKSLCSSYNVKRNGSTPTSGDLSSNESSRVQSGMEKGEAYKGRDSIGQQLQQNLVSRNVYQSEASYWKGFSCQNTDLTDDPPEFRVNCSNRENMKGSDNINLTNVFDVLCPNSTEYSTPFDDYNRKQESIQRKLLEWVHSFFLESLIEEAIESPGRTISRGETVLNIEDTSEICLKAVEILPADASNVIVASLVSWMKSYTTGNSLLQYAANGEIRIQDHLLDSKAQNLEIALQKVWALSKILAALVGGSIFVASGFAKCGGLSSILELYSSLVKISELSLYNDARNKTDILPGGVGEQTSTRLVISPLLTNQYCNVKKSSEVEDSALQVVHGISKQIMKQDIPKGRKCKALGGIIPGKLDSVLNMISLCSRKKLSALRNFVFGQMKRKSQLSQVKDPIKNDLEECTSERNSGNSDVDSTGVNLGVAASGRPKVPKLMLVPGFIFEKKRKYQGPKLFNFESALFAKENVSDLGYLKSTSKTMHECQVMVLEAKICLLEVFHTLLLHHSAAAVSAQKEFIKGIRINMDIMISSFITDLFISFDCSSRSDERNLKEHIFEIIYQLDILSDKMIMKNDTEHTHGDKGHCVDLLNSTKSVQHDLDNSFHECFLQEASENLNLALSDVRLWKDNQASSPGYDFGLKLVSLNYHVSGLPGQLSGISFWKRISILMGVIADYSIFLSAKGLSCPLHLDMCGYIDKALSFFSGLGEPDTWTLPQILAMQSLLNLLKGIFRVIKDDNSPLSLIWTDSDEKIWQAIVRNDKHWTCMKNYLSWLLLESCHGCKTNLFNYWKFYPDMPETLAILLFSKPNFCLESPGFGCIRDAFHWLATLVILSHRRMQVKVPRKKGDLHLFSLEDVSFLSDFLINPVDGLLVKILKGPFLHGRVIYTEREIERGTLNCTIAHEVHMSFLQGKRDCDVSPSLKLSSTRQSTTSISDISNALFPTEKEFPDKPLKVGPLWKYGTLPFRNWSVQTPYLFKILKQLNSELNSNQKFLGIESPGCSVQPHVDYVHCLCRSCTVRVIIQGLSSRISMLIEEECLNLLVHIFSLKFAEDTMKLETQCEMPYLKPRYVDALLDYQFLSFLHLYNWKPEDPHKKIWMSHPPGKNIDISCRISEGNEETPSIQYSSSLEDLSSALFSEDEIITFACRKYGEVLLALSYNKNGNVRNHFRQLKVMDFLIHQIALEYESSNLITPREASPENNFHEVLSAQDTKLNYCLGRQFADDNNSYIDKSRTVRNSVTNEAFLAGVARHGSALNVGVKNPRPIIYLPASARNFNCLRLKEQRTNRKHLLLKSISHQPGYFSCRAGMNKKYSFPIVSRGQFYLFGIQGHQKGPARCGKYLKLPTGRRHLPKASSDNQRNMRRQKTKETPFSSRFCSYNAISLEEDCYDISFVCDDTNVSGAPTSMVSLPKTIEDSNCKHSTDRVDREFEDSNLNKSKSSKQFIYCGRFCDLNEEVEKELAQEDLPITDCHGDRRRSSLRKTEVSNQENCRSVACSNQEPGKTVSSVKRPLVPKLALPKSAQKGDEDLSSLRRSLEEDVLNEKKRPQTPLSPEVDNFRTTDFNSGETYWEDFRRTGSLSYEIERMKRRIYRDSKLHILLLELFVSLMITPEGKLDTSYTDRFPMEGQKMNAPFYLIYQVLPLLRQRMKSFSPSVCRIFKLVWRDLFDSSLYTNKHRIAHGAFAQVYTATFTKMDGDKKVCQSVVLKMVDLPKGPHDPCKFFDVYSEVEILEKFIGDHRVCQLLDYGLDIESFVLVLKQYKCSLRHWRQQFDTRERDASEQFGQAFYIKLSLYLEIYSAVLQAVKVLELHNVVHYDLKCDNILLEPLENLQSEEDFWNPVWPKMVESFHLPFRVCIADFGQSKASMLQGGECTVRNRGTEYVKSPEMLKLLSTNKPNENQMDTPVNDETVGRAVDIWGLGCLLYELLTGEYLLYDEDWTRFFIRVTFASEELITDEKAAKLNNFRPIMEFLNFILVRNPQQRPTLDAVIQRFEQLRAVLKRDGIGCSSCLSSIEDKIVEGSNDTELHAEIPGRKRESGLSTSESSHVGDYELDPHSVLLDPSTWQIKFIMKLFCGG